MRSPNTALISFNAPVEMKAELHRIAKEEYPNQPERGRLSALMREIAGGAINEKKGTKGYAPVSVPKRESAKKQDAV